MKNNLRDTIGTGMFVIGALTIYDLNEKYHDRAMEILENPNVIEHLMDERVQSPYTLVYIG